MLQPYLRRRALENSYWYMGHLSSALATTDDTGGAFSLFEMSIRPGMEPPPHQHSREAEAIYMLDGGVDGFSANRRLTAGPGEMVTLPNGEPHGWRVTAGADGDAARGLLILVPGTFERYFRSFSEPAAALTLPNVGGNQYADKMQSEMGRALADAADYGISWMPPGYQPTLSDATPAPKLPCLEVLGEQYEPLTPASEVAGAFTALVWNSPIESRLPKHLHHDADEAFYILEGEVDFTADNGFAVIARPGDFVFLPKGLAHTHRATGGKPSRAFQILTPGGIETALGEVATLTPDQVTLERLSEIAGRAGMSLLPE